MKGNYNVKPVLKKEYNMNSFNAYVTQLNVFNSRQRKNKTGLLINKNKGRIKRN